MEVLRESPNATSFVPLAEHQSTTPASFYTGPPVLHYYSDRSKVLVRQRELDNAPAFTPLFQHASRVNQESQNGEAHVNGNADVQKVVDQVDVWVTSDKLLLYSATATAGVAIPYRSISLHAIQTLPTPTPETQEQGVYMHLLISQEDTSEDVEPAYFSVTIIPTASAPPLAATSHPDPELETEDEPEQTPVQALFNALSDCANLHPDPVDEDDEEGEGSRLFRAGLAIPGDSSGALPPPMPGSGGWITAENMHEFFDDDGNWIQQEDNEPPTELPAEPLGPGAGSVRVREYGPPGADANGDEETKWQRTS